MYQGTEPRSLPPRSLHSGGESWLHHCLHFTEDGIESQRGYTNVQRHTAGMRRSKDLNPVSLVPGSYPPCHTDATPFTALPPQQRCPGFITAHRGRGLAQNGTLEQRAPCTLALFSSEDVSVLQADRSDSHRAMHSSPPSVPSFLPKYSAIIRETLLYYMLNLSSSARKHVSLCLRCCSLRGHILIFNISIKCKQ